VEAVDGEVLAVDGEDFADAFAFRDVDKGCVSQIHRPVGVFGDEFADSGNVREAERKKGDGATLNHCPDILLRLWQTRQQVHRFTENGPHGGQRFPNLGHD
jgi:hypothetical protein